MDPLLIVLTGTAVMMVSLVGLRLHAFLALVLAAFVVCVLTPPTARQGQLLRESAVAATLEVQPAGLQVTAAEAKVLPAGAVVLFQWDGGRIIRLEDGVLIPTATHSSRLEHTGDAAGLLSRGAVQVVSAAAWKRAEDRSRDHPLERVAEGFGATCASIGLLIILASVIGECLTGSGAASRIVRWIQDGFGERRAPQALAGSAFLLGIPVFFDTVFYLLMPLGRGLAARTGRDFLLYTLSIVAGATMAHSLVPPTPGPLFAAKEFGVSLGAMMAGGTVVGVLSVVVGFFYARWANQRWPLPLRPMVGGERMEPRAKPGTLAVENPPPLGWAVLPIALPVGLIAVSATWTAVAPEATSLGRLIQFLGHGPMALLLGTVVAVLLLVRSFGWRWGPLKEALGGAVASGGVILLITAAGGAFGAALRQTGIAGELARYSDGGGFGLLLAAFGITAAVRIAQGSATVAMLTAAGVVAPVALAASLPFHPVYLALAVGCGSKPVPWLNDSGFWIIGRMSGMTEAETLRSASVMMSLMGCVGFVLVLLGAWWLPLK